MSELFNRYKEACELLRRCKKGFMRSGWEEGETDGVIIDAINDFLDMEELETEFFGATGILR